MQLAVQYQECLLKRTERKLRHDDRTEGRGLRRRTGKVTAVRDADAHWSDDGMRDAGRGRKTGRKRTALDIDALDGGLDDRDGVAAGNGSLGIAHLKDASLDPDSKRIARARQPGEPVGEATLRSAAELDIDADAGAEPAARCTASLELSVSMGAHTMALNDASSATGAASRALLGNASLEALVANAESDDELASALSLRVQDAQNALPLSEGLALNFVYDHGTSAPQVSKSA